MKSRIHAIGAAISAFFVFASSPLLAQTPGHPPAEYFGQLPNVGKPRLSPDGQHLATVQPVQGRPTLIIYPVNAPAGTKPVAVPSPDWVIVDALWVKNDRVMMYLTRDKALGFQYVNAKKLVSWGRAIILDSNGENDVVPFRHNANFGVNLGIGNVADLDLSDPDSIFIPFWAHTDNLSPAEEAAQLKAGNAVGNQYSLNMFRVNARTGDASFEAGGSPTTQEWYLDGQGHVVARVDESANPLVDHVMAYAGGSWRELATFNAEGTRGAGIEGVSEDGASLIRNSWKGGNTLSLTALNLSTGVETPIFNNPDYDVLSGIADEWTGRVVGVEYADDSVKYVYFDPKRMALQRGIEQAFPGLTSTVVSSDLAQDRVIVAAEGPRHPTSYYYLDRTTHQATAIASTYPGLNESDLGEEKPYPYAARDGLAIHAYLTLPPGRPAHNLPTVIFPHGGPVARDAMEFDWWAQFMANRGYAVLQPNYRGSSGYGRKFQDAGAHQWGLKMQDDITDGAKKLIADGIADPKRICIVGASYGGYAALTGATFTPDLYACAVSVAGVTDLPGLLLYERNKTDKPEDKLISEWGELVGTQDDDFERLKATSPALHANAVKCPILLLHGDGDTTVPISQSENEEAALKSAGKSVRFVRLEGDDHYLRLAATRIQMLKEIESFLAANIGN